VKCQTGDCEQKQNSKMKKRTNVQKLKKGEKKIKIKNHQREGKGGKNKRKGNVDWGGEAATT